MATTKPKAPKALDDQLLGMLKQQVGHYVSDRVESLTSKAGDKLTDLTERLTESAENGTPLKLGGRLLKGESPLKAVAGETLSKVKEKVPGLSPGEKTSEESGGLQDGPGDVKATSIVESMDVGVPLRTAYDHWCEYEEFTSFTKGVRDVSKEDEVISDWKVKVAFSTRSWKATVVEQLPDDRIVWKSEGPQGTTHGAVSFHELGPTLTRILLVVEYYPNGFVEKTGNLWRAQGRRLRLDFKHFRRYVTFATEDAEGWRGEIRDGEVVRSHEDAMAEEEAGQDEEAEGAAEETEEEPELGEDAAADGPEDAEAELDEAEPQDEGGEDEEDE